MSNVLNHKAADIDKHWEYLDKIKLYTIDLINDIRHTTLVAVNKNIIAYHKDIPLVELHITKSLEYADIADKRVAQLQALHAGKFGYAMGEADIASFLAINEYYIELQANLLHVQQAHTKALLDLISQAQRLALAASVK